MLNNFFAIGFRQKIVLPGYRKSYPRNPEMYSYLSFDHNAYFCLKMSDLVYVVIINLLFISRSYLGQKPVKTANSLKIFRTLNTRGEQKQFHNLYEVLSQVCLRQHPVTDIFQIKHLRVRRY
jgi:hypothetical protein